MSRTGLALGRPGICPVGPVQHDTVAADFAGAQLEGVATHDFGGGPVGYYETLLFTQDGRDFMINEPYQAPFTLIHNVGNSDDLAPLSDAGIMTIVHNTHLSGGDILMRRAWDNSHATNSTAFALDLQGRAVPGGCCKNGAGRSVFANTLIARRKKAGAACDIRKVPRHVVILQRIAGNSARTRVYLTIHAPPVDNQIKIERAPPYRDYNALGCRAI